MSSLSFGMNVIAEVQAEAQMQAEEQAKRQAERAENENKNFRYTWFNPGETKIMQFLMPCFGKYRQHETNNGKDKVTCTKSAQSDPSDPSKVVYVGPCRACDEEHDTPRTVGFIAGRHIGGVYTSKKSGKQYSQDNQILIWRGISMLCLNKMLEVIKNYGSMMQFPLSVTRIADNSNSKEYSFLPKLMDGVVPGQLQPIDHELLAKLQTINWDAEMDFGTPTAEEMEAFCVMLRRQREQEAAKASNSLGTQTDLTQPQGPTQPSVVLGVQIPVPAPGSVPPWPQTGTQQGYVSPSQGGAFIQPGQAPVGAPVPPVQGPPVTIMTPPAQPIDPAYQPASKYV